MSDVITAAIAPRTWHGPPPGAGGYAVEARGVVKDFGTHRALDGVDLVVPTGTVLGLLGPNGAGKTTMVKVLTTLLQPDAGQVSVAGFDVVARAADVRRSIGLSGQYAAIDDTLTGYENLYLVGRLYGLGRKGSSARARELLARFRLEDAADRQARTYSGGMRRRLDLAGALVALPSVVVLDEPTTGLDPRSRLDTWEMVRRLIADGTSVLLTTQYLEEADQLADSIVVIDRGRVIEQGTADELKSRVGSERLEFVVADAADLPALCEVLTIVGAAEPTLDEHMRRGHVLVHDGVRTLAAALRLLEARDLRVLDVSLHRPRLDDVFLSLTEHPTDDNEPGDTGNGDER